jgi:hypothetical protein
MQSKPVQQLTFRRNWLPDLGGDPNLGSSPNLACLSLFSGAVVFGQALASSGRGKTLFPGPPMDARLLRAALPLVASAPVHRRSRPVTRDCGDVAGRDMDELFINLEPPRRDRVLIICRPISELSAVRCERLCVLGDTERASTMVEYVEVDIDLRRVE